MTVKLGVALPQFTDDPLRFVEGARRAEAAGLDSVWVFDHLWPLSGGKQRPILECWTALAWAAAITQRVMVGTLVTRSTLRHPAVLGKMARTVNAISKGRGIVALGSGDEMSRTENEAFGLPYLEGDDRIAELEETIAIVRRCLRGGTVTYRGRLFDIEGLHVGSESEPAPVWVAGTSSGVLSIAAREADGWNAWGGTPERFAARARQIRRAAPERPVALTWATQIVLGDDDDDARARLGARDPRAFLHGDAETVAARLREFVAAGADHIVGVFPHAGDEGTYEAFATSVKPLVEAP